MVKLVGGAFEGAYSFGSRFEQGTGTKPDELIAATIFLDFEKISLGSYDRPVKMKMILDEAKRVLEIEAEAILAIKDRLNASFTKAVELILECKGRIIISGMGKSGLVGRKIAATLASTGTPAFFIHPGEAIHGDLGMITDDDILLAISKSGNTEELAAILPYIKRKGLKLIAMVGNLNSHLAKVADIVLDVTVAEEACPLGQAPTASTTAALALGDALAIVLLKKRGFRLEDFASLHPGGSLGKRLITRVEDLMHTGDDIPFVYPDATLAEVLVVMTSKKLGCTCVADSDNHLLGIFTDGDLRRLLPTKPNLDALKINEIMTRNPSTIDKDSLAVKALKVMEGRITQLPVVDSNNRLIGIVHIHDLLKAGIV